MSFIFENLNNELLEFKKLLHKENDLFGKKQLGLTAFIPTKCPVNKFSIYYLEVYKKDTYLTYRQYDEASSTT